MTHPLDRPVWTALNGGFAPWVVRSGAALRLDPAYGPFAAAEAYDARSLADLAGMLRSADDAIAVIEPVRPRYPVGTVARREGMLLQMTCETPADAAADPRIVALGEGDVAEMSALALATEPGPWGPFTHRLGAFYGIRIDGRLAAMAGQRMRAPGWSEVSAVCTWPEYRGRGLAAALVQHVVSGFAERGERAFLHTYAENAGAVRLYEALGFAARTELTLSVLGPA